jgi:hypothetical protein
MPAEIPTTGPFPKSTLMIEDAIEEAIFDAFGMEPPAGNSRPIRRASMVAESLGRSAFNEGKGLDSNPFSWLRDGTMRQEWSDGWFAARDDLGRRRKGNPMTNTTEKS